MTDTHSRIRETARKEGWVLYDGNWYSVGTFLPYHPGGSEILTQYLGTDISFVFRTMHRNPETIMKRRKVQRAATEEEKRTLLSKRNQVCHEMMEDFYQGSVSSAHKCKSKKFNLESFEQDMRDLYQSFVDRGFFQPTLLWLCSKTALVFLFLSLSLMTMKLLPGVVTDSSSSTSAISYILPGIFLGLFWHQSGFLMHDAEVRFHISSHFLHYILNQKQDNQKVASIQRTIQRTIQRLSHSQPSFLN